MQRTGLEWGWKEVIHGTGINAGITEINRANRKFRADTT